MRTTNLITLAILSLFSVLLSAGIAETSVKIITDSPTGGDCELIGKWDLGSRTCTLTSDVADQINIDGDGITLDGNSFSTTNSTGLGVYVEGKTSVTIKNIDASYMVYGIYLVRSSGCTVSANVADGNKAYGIVLYESDGNTIAGNTAASNGFDGIILFSSNDNTLTSNTANGDYSAIVLSSSNGNTLTGNVLTYNLCNCDTGSYGIHLIDQSNDNTLIMNTISADIYNGFGIGIDNSDYNTVTDNTLLHNLMGINLSYSDSNKIYNNNFLDNLTQAYVSAGSGNAFYLDGRVGGNYWSNWTTPDNNIDGFVDFPFVITAGGVDNLPWTMQNGWHDNTPPTTSVLLSGTKGNSDWWRSDVTVTLEASDSIGGSGVARTPFSLDGGSYQTYTGVFVISREGTTQILAFSEDKVGNAEDPPQEAFVKIDKTPPIIQVSPPLSYEYLHSDTLVPTFSATDSVSGLATGYPAATLDSTVVNSGQPINLLSLSLGTHTLSVVAVDNAGNSESQSLSFKIIATLDSLTAAVNYFAQNGEIDGNKLWKSLLGKLNEAQEAVRRGNTNVAVSKLKDFIDQLNAQSGKHITTNAASLLITDAGYVIGQL